MRTLHTSEILYSPDLQSPLVDTALLADEEGRILALGTVSALRGEEDRQIDHQILMPGVVNAHIHLTDAGRSERVPGGEGLVPWVRTLMGSRSAGLTPEEWEGALRATLEDMKNTGTVAVGEVVNDGRTLPALRTCGMDALLIHELIAFRHDRIDGVLAGADALFQENRWDDHLQHALGAHAPYSVAPELMRTIVAKNRAAGKRTYQHLAEDPDERELYEKGTGRWKDFLEGIGAWEMSWNPPGLSPIHFYDRLGILDENFVAVHLADASGEELELLGRRGVKAILSPRSNLHITGLFPDVRKMIAAGITLAFGTDGRGSSPGMDVFGEASVVLERLPDLPPGTLLRALTLGGAEVLGFHGLGRIAVGSCPGLVSVRIRGDSSSDLSDLGELEREVLSDGAVRERAV